MTIYTFREKKFKTTPFMDHIDYVIKNYNSLPCVFISKEEYCSIRQRMRERAYQKYLKTRKDK